MNYDLINVLFILSGEISLYDAGKQSVVLKVIYHPLYSMNNYVLIWGDRLSYDPLRGSHDSQSHHIWG